MKFRLLFSLAALGLSVHAQSWSAFLDPSRAIAWTSAGFTIPSYTTNCSTQPALTANSVSAAAANTTAIQNALASCNATHNVVSVPSGTYYVAGWTYGAQGKQVVRGAGASATHIILTNEVSCGGLWHGVCMLAANWTYDGNSNVLPPTGSNQCTWSSGYAQGTTTITLNSCGGTPPVNQMIILDQANDTSDTSGVYICNSETTGCSQSANGSYEGRKVNGVYHSLQQATYVTGVTSLGGGSYSVTVSPGVYFTNIRSSQSPGAWWPGFVQNDGLENLTLDASYQSGGSYQVGDGTLGIFSCYQCWTTNVIFPTSARNAVFLYQTANAVIRNNYFYSTQSHYTESYTIEPHASSAFLVENNIFQQVTTPLAFVGATGAVVDYNFSLNDIFSDGSYTWGAYASHNAGNNFNLFEGNNFYGIWIDDTWGSTNQVTIFRNMLSGFQPGTSNNTVPILDYSYVRGVNVVGNVLGQPGYQTGYQVYATSPTVATTGSQDNSIYALGWGWWSGCGSGFPNCDPLTFSTMMRWGNYDTVNAAVRWNSTEASPGAVTYMNANFTSSYFTSLAHTLPASLYYSSTPSWWPSGKAWPLIGPDISSGNLGICTGTYSGWQATSSSQCTGGSLTSAWASHANSIPAQDCYLNVLNGPLNGSGNVLAFDASLCYQSSTSGGGPSSPTGLTATVN